MTTTGRGLVRCHLTITPDTRMLAVDLLCDCGHACLLELDIRGDLTRGHEFAYTCDGCLTAHWLTLKPLETT